MTEQRANVLSPIIVALIKDSALGFFLEKWQNETSLLTFKDVQKIFSENDIDALDSSPIIIKKEFIHFSLPEINLMIDQAYSEFDRVIKNVLRAVGRENDGSGNQNFEWGHSHPH
jgi:hypothetical protein